MRSVAVASVIVAGCILSLGACSGDETSSAEPDGGASSGNSSSGGSSSGSSTSSSSGNASSSSSSGEVDSGLVPVGDGSLGAGCNKDDECNSKVCGAGRKCVATKSCRPSTGSAPGIDTCGPKEPGDESCCKSLTLPVTKTRTLDKYEITSGRVRAFIDDLQANHGGNLRKLTTDFATANPTSQLGKLATDFPGYLDVVVPNDDKVFSEAQLPLWLGAFPHDAINRYDGCYLNSGGYGAATYWQDPAVLKEYGIGYTSPGNGVRKYGKDVLDKKPANCMPPIFLAIFCAWDGGELARTSDYREVYGNQPATVGAAQVFHPWSTLLSWGEFNWANGHGQACFIPGWPGCPAGAQTQFYAFPTGGTLADDDSPSIGAPGRFPKDVTKAVSEDGGEGWFDVGGNLLEAMWPNTKPIPAIKGYCDTAAGGGAGALACNRNQPASGAIPAESRPGTLRFAGDTPPIFLEGFSFEGHSLYSAAYLASDDGDEAKLGGATPAHFQYGKVGGRCARVKK
ncbi:MAG: hypothetical protein KIT84_25200 [Labilithrix sp.]|nr:hypothetical protein [Labilithrix sp.]MCW5814349.1 hypothetical protein [Labilithrix sp.]